MPVRDYGRGWQTGYRTQMDVALPGLCKLVNQCNTYLNTGTIVAQVVAIDIGTVADGTQYDIGVDGQTVSFTSGVGATFTEVRDGLVAALEANTTIGANWFVVSGGADPGILITGRNPAGSAVMVTVAGGAAGYQVNAGASVNPSLPGAIPFGRMLTQRTTYSSSQAHLPDTAGELQVGVSVRSHDVQPVYGSAGLSSAYGSGEAMNVLSGGVIWVECESAIALGDTVYYRHTADGALEENGIFAGAAGTGLEQLVAARWEGPSVAVQNFSGGKSVLIAPLWINLP